MKTVRPENRRKIYIALSLVVTLYCIGGHDLISYAANTGPDPAVTVQVDSEHVRIIAQNAPLADILGELARQGDFQFDAGGALSEVVTLDIETASVEKAVVNLTRNMNRIMFYKTLSDGSEVLAKVTVFGTGSAFSISDESKTPEPIDDRLRQNDDQLRFDPDWYKGVLSDTAALSRQIKTKKESISASDLPPDLAGIEVVEVAADSLFNRIGIVKGDIIRDVNGTRINSVKSLVKAMNWTPESPSVIRIERLNSEGLIDPVYYTIEKD